MRIATWNMQGGTNTPYIKQVINDTQANIICLQECGTLTTFLFDKSPIIGVNGSIIGYRGNFNFGNDFMSCVYWENNDWSQGGLAILSDIEMIDFGILSAVDVPGFYPTNKRNLPWILVRDPYTNVNKIIFTIHSPPIPDNIVDVCRWNNAQIDNIAYFIANAEINSWVCLGDFNADPTNPGYKPSIYGRICYGSRSTQQSLSILDYAVTNSNINFVGITKLCGASDHYPQTFDF